MNITEHCLALFKIIDYASSLDVRLTHLKLVDSWFHKGQKNLRCKEVAVPNFERYYAEQMVAFLLIKGYLKEDFHFTAYSTISYIKKGDRIVDETDRIIFYGARVLLLPERNEFTKKEKQAKKANEEESVYLTDSDAPPAKKVKKEKKSKTNGASSHSEQELNVSMNSSRHESSPKKKKKSKHEKTEQSMSNSPASEVGDDCVILVEGSDVIEID